jgi:CRISPR-associated protein Cmr3
MLGKMNGGFLDKEAETLVTKLLDICIDGPFPLKDHQLYFPVPKDILAKKNGKEWKVITLRPVLLEKGSGCDFPIVGLLPAMIPESNDEDFKPEKLPAFWSKKKMTEWLIDPDGVHFTLCKSSNEDNGGQGDGCERKKKKECWENDPDFLDAPKKDIRIHAGIDSNSGAAEDGMLFMSIGLDLTSKSQFRPVLLSARARVRMENNSVCCKQINELNEIHPFGGERRLAHWSRSGEPVGWKCPSEIPKKLEELNTGKIRMVLATPAIFSKGWLPGWIDSVTLEGIPPRLKDDTKFKLKLISACTDRWRPISGWSAKAKSRGPKAIRRMVPAGSVYFFEAKSAEAASAEAARDLANSHWLESVCDNPQDCKDGFGLAVWGVWEEAKKS